LDYLFTQFRVILTYLRLLIFPVHQNLDYDYPISHSLLEPNVFFSFLFLSAFLGLAFYLLFYSQRSTRHYQLKLIGFGLLWFFLTLSIESSIIPIRDVIFEHRLYLPSVGFFLAGSVAILGLLDRWRGMTAIVIGILLALSSVATYQRNLVWKDELSLWSDVAQKSPFKIRGHNNLAEAYVHLGQYHEAMQEYKAIITLDPKDVRAHIGLGVAYQMVGSHDEAIQEYKSASILDPNSALAHFDLGNVYKDVRRLEEAIQEFQIALKLEPDRFQAHNNLGTAYLQLGRPEEAIQELQITLKLEPGLIEARYNLGQAYRRMGRIQEASREFERALQIRPDYDPARQALKSLR